MSAKKIVLIGAGSMVFSSGLMRDLVLTDDFAGSTVWLVDIDKMALEVMTRIARRMVDVKGASLRIESTVDRREALPGSDFVITTIAVGGHEAWRADLEIPLRHGIVQTVGDSVGPGGLARAFRHVPVLAGVARDMEELCPNAWLFNYSNPMSILCRAVQKVSSIRGVGLCHGMIHTRDFLADYLEVSRNDVQILVAGVNHLTWVTSFLVGGQDGYPLLRQTLARKGPRDRPAAFKLFEIYGFFPGPGHSHVQEFYPYFVSGSEQDRALWLVEQNDIGAREAQREQRWQHYVGQSEGRVPIQLRPSGENVTDIMLSLMKSTNNIFAVNLPNRGYITNLPREGIVEISAVVNGAGMHGIGAGDLPLGLAIDLQARISQQELAVDAALTGDRDLAFQAMLADPMVTNIQDAESMLGELLAAHAGHLPQFF
jgi:alpha-galactosidase